ncbi:MAG TPA: hypothetical protein VFP47_00495 [Pyrinomonadaceae bacterium]|nr:hypothetical protein [Pyrinomonadaceae bacterium]
MRDVETLQALVRVVLIVTAISVTLFPLLYASLATWYRSQLGIAVMLQSLSIALVIDYSAIRRYVFPGASTSTTLTVYLVLMSLVCLTSLFLTVTLLYLNFRPKEQKNVRNRRPG